MNRDEYMTALRVLDQAVKDAQEELDALRDIQYRIALAGWSE